MVTMWHIWDARNKTREDDVLIHPNSVVSKIISYLNMIFVHLYKPVSDHRCVPSSSSHKWVPPPEGTVLVNVDAAVFAPSRCMGAGVVIRNHRGLCLAACQQLFEEVTSPELAEARAVLHAIVFAREEGFSKIIIGSDCASVIQRLLSKTTDRSLFGPVVADIKKVAVSFISCEFQHVYRDSNVAAHLLARSCASVPSSVWRGVSPDLIRQTICNDIMIT
jgi:ribonuclease HI